MSPTEVITQETGEMTPQSPHSSSEALDDLSIRTQMEIEIPQLPPTDHGKQAYLVLAGCTLIQAPVWGQCPDIITNHT